MKTDLSIIALSAALAALPVFADGPKASDFRLKVTGVAVAEDNRSGKYAVGKPLPAETRVVVGSERQLAMFFVEYELPVGVSARIWLEANCSGRGSGGRFGSSPSGLYAGRQQGDGRRREQGEEGTVNYWVFGMIGA